MSRLLLLTFGASLLMLTGLLAVVRRQFVEPYYLEFNTSDMVNGGLDTCRLLYFDQPLECGYLNLRWITSVSPDGRWRTYVQENLEGYAAIIRTPIQGDDPQQITEPLAFSVIGLQEWSPDGEWLAFSAYGAGGSGLDIFRLAVATGEVVQLTNLPGDEWYPAWSSDGERMAFNARDTLGGSGLFIMDAKGGDLHEPLPGLPQSFYPQWSPDGEWLLFQTNCAEDVLRSLGERPCAAAHFDLYRLRLSDGHIESLLTLPGDEYDPVWSPDGGWVAFTSRVDLTSQAGIFRIRPDGSDLQPVINDLTRSYFSPSWVRTPNNKWHPVILLTISLVMMGVIWLTDSRFG